VQQDATIQDIKMGRLIPSIDGSNVLIDQLESDHFSCIGINAGSQSRYSVDVPCNWVNETD
jgi:hypothetical protein